MKMPISTVVVDEDRYVEMALIGTALIDKDFCEGLLGALEGKHFAVDAHGRIFEAIRTCASQGAVDIASVALLLRTQGALQALGGVQGLSSAVAASCVIDPSALAGHVSRMRSAYVRRLRTRIADVIRIAGCDAAISDDDFLGRVSALEAEFEAETVRPTDCPLVQSYDAVVDYMKHFADTLDGVVPSALSTGIDGLTIGEKELIVLAADSGCGKSTLAIQIASHLAADGHGVVFFGLEMSRREIMASIHAAKADVSLDVLACRRMANAREYDQIIGAANKISQWPFFIYDGASLSIADVRTHIKGLQRSTKTKIKLVCLDYLRLFALGDEDTEELKISAFTRACKELAKELDVTILLCAQLSRDVKKNHGGRPTMKDLKGSSSIENNANKIWLIYRQFISVPNKNSENARAIEDMAEIIVDKNRSGKIGSFKVKFEGEFARFSAASENDLTRWQAALACVKVK